MHSGTTVSTKIDEKANQEGDFLEQAPVTIEKSIYPPHADETERGKEKTYQYPYSGYAGAREPADYPQENDSHTAQQCPEASHKATARHFEATPVNFSVCIRAIHLYNNHARSCSEETQQDKTRIAGEEHKPA